MPRPDDPKPAEIRDRVERDDYRVDPRAVADAIVRQLLAASQRPRP